MNTVYTGGCACGAIRYEATEDPSLRTTANAAIAGKEAAPVTHPT